MERDLRHPKISKAYVRLVAVGGAVLMAVTMLMAYWLVFPAQMITATPGGLQTDRIEYPPNVRRVTITDNGEFCNHGVSTEVTRKIQSSVGGIILNTIYFSAPLEPVCIPPREGKYIIDLPNEVPAGTWRIVMETKYQANPVRSVTMVRESNEFKILP